MKINNRKQQIMPGTHDTTPYLGAGGEQAVRHGGGRGLHHEVHVREARQLGGPPGRALAPLGVAGGHADHAPAQHAVPHGLLRRCGGVGEPRGRAAAVVRLGGRFQGRDHLRCRGLHRERTGCRWVRGSEVAQAQLAGTVEGAVGAEKRNRRRIERANRDSASDTEPEEEEATHLSHLKI